MFILAGNRSKMFELLYILLCILPICHSVDLTYIVEEGKSSGTYIGDIATDSKIMDDVSQQDKKLITFSQLQGKVDSSQYFQVSKKTGKLYTIVTLDAEAMCKRNEECFQLIDVAVRKGASSMRILEIKVIIKDINDHKPEFPDKQINIEFEEDSRKGAKILIPNAIDKDVGQQNSKISYELKKMKNEPFSLYIAPGVEGASVIWIKLEETLDREDKDSYVVQVVVKDAGSPPKQNTLNVHISVIDVNDNLPVFTKKGYNISIRNEESKVTPIVTLSATDLDSGQNGRLSYHWSYQTPEIAKSFFQLIETTGQIFLQKKFNPGDKIINKLYVKAEDGGSPPLSSTAILYVNMINHENTAPAIDINFPSASNENTIKILENAKVSSFIAYVKVTDNDEGQNGEVTCHLHHDKFQLQNLGTKKYEVTLKKPLDREKEEHHDVVISCQDKGSPPLHSNSKFSIQVMDINDVEPQFTKDTFKFLIDENQNSRVTVGYINATDPDLGAGGKLTYSLITNNKHFLPFKISTNGLLSAIMSLDHEFQDTYQFQVFVKDNGTPSLNNTVNVIVEVTDKNDNAPYFTFPSVKPYNLDVTYYPHHTKNITQIKAVDIDSQENAFLKYQIISGNDKQMFSMNQYTGLLGFNRQLSPENAGSYQLDIVVKDSGSPVLSATTTLFLSLTISNNTLQILNVVELESEEKVHLNLVIIITVIAVTIAVFITASLSICIIRCNGQPNVAYAQALDPSNRYVSEQRHLIVPSYQGNSWPQPAQPMPIDQTPSTNTPLTTSRRQLTCADRFPQKPQPSNEVVSQVSNQVVTFFILCSFIFFQF